MRQKGARFNMSVIRYTPALVYIYQGIAVRMAEHATGGYVRFRDYAALETENERLRLALIWSRDGFVVHAPRCTAYIDRIDDALATHAKA